MDQPKGKSVQQCEPRQGSVAITKDSNGIGLVKLRSPQGATALVSLHGGQVLSWKTVREKELLFTSKKTGSKVTETGSKVAEAAIVKPPAALRGGIPICFPQFGNRGTVEEQYGFARNRTWDINTNPSVPLRPNESYDKSYIDLLLKSCYADSKIWPHSYEFHLRVALGDGNLNLISRIRNTDSKPCSFSIAYQTYLSVSDIEDVRVEGLEALHYLDNLQERKRLTEQCDALTFESEVDRVYLSTEEPIAVFDHQVRQTVTMRKEGLPDVGVWNPWDIGVWNPWDKKSKLLPDFGKDEYKHMLRVDAAAVENPIELKPGEEWTGRLELSFKPSTS